MAVTAATVSVASDQAYLIVAAANANANPSGYTSPLGFRSVVLTNISAQPVYIGGAGVTGASNGYKLAAGASTPTLNLAPTDAVYGIAAAFTQLISYLAS